MTPLTESFLDRLASAAVQEGLADAVYTTVSTPLGRLLVAQGERGVLRIAFEEEPEDLTLAGVAAGVGPRIVRSDRELAATRDAISAYLEGDDDTLDLPVDLSLARGPFRRAVLEAATYGALAAEAGNPRAVRATGTACATNPVPIVVPCHRVLPASHKLGNYGGGPDRKRALLTLEGAPWRA
jgi:methylated-DNA-[protein]-cysteine S-methyltransferase